LCEEPLDAGFICDIDCGGTEVAQFGFLALTYQAVGSIGMEALDLTGAGQLETLFGAGMRFEFRHGGRKF
jgi:hypothetical protein